MLLVIRERKIQTYPLVWLCQKRKIISVKEDVEKLELAYIIGGDIK